MAPAFGGQGGQNTALTLYANKGVILEADWLCCSETLLPVYETRYATRGGYISVWR